MKRSILALLILISATQVTAQQRINGNFAFQTDPSKEYSIYIPSTYVSTTPNKLMLGLHPLNTNRWNGVSWCDTLINFAESNGLLLVCPDGGADGRIDDAIDTAFTTVLLDSMRAWYNVDNNQVYAMGFSWGARTTYTYGLRRPHVFGGFIPIGAAITRTNEVTVPLQLNSNNKAVYIIHGSFDNPAVRFLPVRDSLIAKGAILNFKFLNGVGHTIDFANRNAILNTAFNWVDSVNNSQLVGIKNLNLSNKEQVTIFPNPIRKGETAQFEIKQEITRQLAEVKIYNIEGRLVQNFNQNVQSGKNTIDSKFSSLARGTYFISILLSERQANFWQEIIIQ